MKRRLAAVLAAAALVAVFFGVLPVGGAEAYDNDYPFSSLSGTWTMSSGSGTVNVDGSTGTLSLESGTVRISSLSTSGSAGSASVRVESDWELRVDSSYIDYPFDFKTSGWVFTNTASNVYGTSYIDGTATGNAVITLTSETTGVVTQTETNTSTSNGYIVTITYSIRKTSDDVDDDDDDGSSGCSAGWGALALVAAVPLLFRKRR